MPVTAYGDISPRTAAYAAAEMLKRGIPYLVLEKFGQAKPIPKKSSKTITFRRYEALDPTPAPLTEGVTPASKQLTVTDVSATLSQYGDHIEITDVVMNARKITSVVKSTPAYGTEAVAPAYIALCHPDLEGDIRNMAGFVPTEKYGQMTPFESEIGKVEDVRYVTSTIFDPWIDSGAAVDGTKLSTGGANNDVYPILYIARDAYGIVPLKGKNAITPMVVNPKPSDSDPLAQRVLNDLWMVRAEVAASLNP